MSWFKFINKIKPDGKAFRAIEWSKILFEVIADGLQEVINYADFQINDQVWYVNDNFDPEPWEERYNITPPPLSSLTERREIVRSYMLYPQSANRLSLDYMQSEVDNLGLPGITLDYNPTGDDTGLLHANDGADEKTEFSMGSLTYNSFVVSGTVQTTFYKDTIRLLMSLKPLQVALYDQLDINLALAYDEDFALAIDDTTTLAIKTL
jgi:hypothetical protein